MPDALIEKLRPLWGELVSAILSDPSYLIEMAQSGRGPQPKETKPLKKLELSGV